MYSSPNLQEMTSNGIANCAEHRNEQVHASASVVRFEKETETDQLLKRKVMLCKFYYSLVRIYPFMTCNFSNFNYLTTLQLE